MHNIKDIINNFFHHSFSKEMTENYQRQILGDKLSLEQDETLYHIWQEVDSDVSGHSNQKEKVWARLKQAMESDLMNVKSRFVLKKWLYRAAIWILPLCMMGSTLYFYFRSQSLKQEMATVSMQQEFAVQGEIRKITLPDGSNVWLNSGSLLMYPSQFIKEHREVYLSGEGYFEVVKNEQSPFIVKTRASQVKVLGTHFNVSAYPEESRIVTTLKEGAVAVELKDNGRTFLLTPNEQLIYKPAVDEALKHTVDADEYINWKEDDGLAFYKTPFDEVMNALQRHYGVNISMTTSNYENNQLTIHLKKNESLENVMKLVRIMIPELKYEICDDTVYIE